MPLRTRLARRLALVLPGVALLGAIGCAHVPEAKASAAREAKAGALHDANASAPRAPADRVLVTGSRIPRPVGRDGLPITDSPVKIYWRHDLGDVGEVDVARAIRKLDVDAR